MPKTDRHSRIVGWLKLVLPMSALALLSTLFLLADRIDPSKAIPYANVDVEDLARDPRMTMPTYAGTTTDGASVTMTAEAARPATENRTAAAETVNVQIDMPNGGSSTIDSATAEIDTAAGLIRLRGNVTVTDSSGYVVKSEAMDAALNRTGIVSPGKVFGTGPQLELEADQFTLQQNQAATDYLLVFSGSVKLVYQPGG